MNKINSSDIVMFIIVLITIFGVSNAQYHNGRYDICLEQGKFYTNEKTCLTCEETGRAWQYGECIIQEPEINWSLGGTRW